MLSQVIQDSWYKPFGFVTVCLLPVSLLFCFLSMLRRFLYQINVLKKIDIAVPVIVVGNINVGGTGKTPLVIAITQYLKAQGYKPGVISRGYGGKSRQWPQDVSPDSEPKLVGDEAVVIAHRCRCPVSVGPDRIASAQSLIEQHQCNVIISDDGLQHYRLVRDIEIAVIDGVRRFGNGFCLPAGPLRELPGRLKKVDLVVSNGKSQPDEYEMELKSYAFHKLNNDTELKPLDAFTGSKVHAVSGIGNNERFFQQLQNLDINITKHPFSDHYRYRQKDLSFKDENPVLMTEKDAVKCKKFPMENAWYLRIDALLENRFYEKLNQTLRKCDGQKTT